MSRHSGRYYKEEATVMAKKGLSHSQQEGGRLNIIKGFTARKKGKFLDTEAQYRYEQGRIQKLEELLELNKEFYKIKEAAKPTEIQLAEKLHADPQFLTPDTFSSESGHIRADIVIRLMSLLLAISLLLTSVGCAPSYDTGGVAPTAIATQIAPEASPAPQAVTPETEDASIEHEQQPGNVETIPGDEETPSLEENPVEEASPEIEETPIATEDVINAIQEDFPTFVATPKITVTAINNYMSFTIVPGVDGDVGTVYLATREGTEITVRAFNGDESELINGKIVFKTNDGVETGSVNLNTGLVTVTPEAEPAPTPEEIINFAELTPDSQEIQLENVVGGADLFTLTQEIYPVFAERNISEVRVEIVAGGAGEQRDSYTIPTANLVVYSIDGITIGVFNPETKQVLPASGGREINFNGEIEPLPIPVLFVNEQHIVDGGNVVGLIPKSGQSLIEAQRDAVTGMITYLAYEAHTRNDLPDYGFGQYVGFGTFSAQTRRQITNAFVNHLLEQLDSQVEREQIIIRGLYFSDLSKLQAIILRVDMQDNNIGLSQQLGHFSAGNASDETALSMLLTIGPEHIDDQFFLGGEISAGLRKSLSVDQWSTPTHNEFPVVGPGTNDLSEAVPLAFAGLTEEEIKAEMFEQNPGSTWHQNGLPFGLMAGGEDKIPDNPLGIPNTDPIGVISLQ